MAVPRARWRCVGQAPDCDMFGTCSWFGAKSAQRDIIHTLLAAWSAYHMSHRKGVETAADGGGVTRTQISIFSVPIDWLLSVLCCTV